jgi:ribonucleoside-diphosphate reductase alpha chain
LIERPGVAEEKEGTMAAGDMAMPALDKGPSKVPERAWTASKTGLALERFFTRPGIDPFTEVGWELRAIVIAREDGRVFFQQHSSGFEEALS